MTLELGGIHHLTAVTAEAKKNLAFYTQTLGMRLIKKTVNQDDTTAYHLFYGDGVASPGADLTFFDFPAEHWGHLKTSHPIESTFASVRLRTRVTKGPGSKAAGLAMASPRKVAEFLALWLRDRPYEVFAVLFLDAQNRLMSAEELFRGTLTQTAVYPRQVARRALELNAAAVIVAHNHPSGVAEPSAADDALTGALKTALAPLEVPVLDHLIVAGNHCYSFAERGRLASL